MGINNSMSPETYHPQLTSSFVDKDPVAELHAELPDFQLVQ